MKNRLVSISRPRQPKRGTSRMRTLGTDHTTPSGGAPRLDLGRQQLAQRLHAVREARRRGGANRHAVGRHLQDVAVAPEGGIGARGGEQHGVRALAPGADLDRRVAIGKRTAQQRDQQVRRAPRLGLAGPHGDDRAPVEDEGAAVAIDLDLRRPRNDVHRPGDVLRALTAAAPVTAAGDRTREHQACRHNNPRAQCDA